MTEEINTVRERVSRLEADGFGIRRDIGELKEDIRRLFDRVGGLQIRIAAITGGGVIVGYLLNHFSK